MACGGCAARKNGGRTVEYKVKFRDGHTETAKDLATVRRMLALGGGGSYEAVAKPAQ